MALLLQTLFSATALADAGRNRSSGGSNELPSSRSAKKKKKLSAARLSSPSNPFVKHCVKLRLSSSYRRSQGSALVVGLTPIMEVCRFWQLNSGELSNIECLLLLDGMEIPEMLNLPSISIVHVSPHVIKKLSGVQSVDSTEAVALIKIPRSFYDMLGEHKEEIYPSWFPLPNRLLVLDGIQDPGNLGTLLRSSMAFRWSAVFLLPGCCDPFNDKAIRAARGASFQLPIICGSWSHLESLTRRFRMKMMGGHPENYGESSHQISVLSAALADALSSEPLCLVLGSEGEGLSHQALQSCQLLSIPMAGMFESLNVSVAGGIFLYMLQPERNSGKMFTFLLLFN
ncbi:hypothetical protein KSP39_PZI008810 [Platanthera zijinensis]|uniref:tRNA/rRNA methyltransferase SpoU type domain-containing protein n=1 Tax=Platanthera zijinensis TaxID=2320716 RepID=A0AAP0BMF6_9ASPA